ncbi:hypothetical protein J2W96_007681 [Variovorax guangxiensis]|nr:hypothetical protein [Variovorax guangxiensis]
MRSDQGQSEERAEFHAPSEARGIEALSIRIITPRMKAMKTLTSLQRLVNRLLALIGRPVPVRPAKPAPVPRSWSPPAPEVAKTAREQTRTQRSPEQLRTDLARLRANSSQRHAPVPIERPTTFDDAVFANFTAAATVRPHEEYPRTVYVPGAASGPQARTRE